MNERDYLAERFEEHRPHLRAVAYRMLGSLGEVDDAVVRAHEDERVDPVLEGVLAELAAQRVAHALPGVGGGIQVLGQRLGFHVGSMGGGQERGSAGMSPARTPSGAGHRQAPGTPARTSPRRKKRFPSSASPQPRPPVIASN